MKKKYRIKKSAKNEFSALTGLPATQMAGSIDCLVAHQLTSLTSATTTGFSSSLPVPVKKLAYCVYNKVPLSDVKTVTQTCGVAHCVKREHLEAEMKNQNGWVVS